MFVGSFAYKECFESILFLYLARWSPPVGSAVRSPDRLRLHNVRRRRRSRCPANDGVGRATELRDTTVCMVLRPLHCI